MIFIKIVKVLARDRASMPVSFNNLSFEFAKFSGDSVLLLHGGIPEQQFEGGAVCEQSVFGAGLVDKEAETAFLDFSQNQGSNGCITLRVCQGEKTDIRVGITQLSCLFSITLYLLNDVHAVRPGFADVGF